MVHWCDITIELFYFDYKSNITFLEWKGESIECLQWFSASSLHTWFEMVTCKVDVDNVTRFQRKERMPTRTIFSDTHFKYDADFWGEFNVIPWEEELGTVIEKLSPKIEQIEY